MFDFSQMPFQHLSALSPSFSISDCTSLRKIGESVHHLHLLQRISFDYNIHVNLHDCKKQNPQWRTIKNRLFALKRSTSQRLALPNPAAGKSLCRVWKSVFVVRKRKGLSEWFLGKLFFKTTWWEINQIASFCKLWSPGHLMGIAALENSMRADFLKLWGWGWRNLFCGPGFFAVVLFFVF